MKHPSERKSRGFSLVEIAMALGVVAFALSAIIGLLSFTLQSESRSQDDIVISAMTTQVMADLRRQSFSGVVFTSGTAPTVAGASGTNGIFPDTSGTSAIAGNTALPSYYFDHSGIRITGSSAGAPTHTQAVAAGAVYQCSPTIASGTVPGGPSAGPVNLVNVSLSFYWPAAAISGSSIPPTNAPNSRTIYTSIARY